MGDLNRRRGVLGDLKERKIINGDFGGCNLEIAGGYIWKAVGKVRSQCGESRAGNGFKSVETCTSSIFIEELLCNTRLNPVKPIKTR